MNLYLDTEALAQYRREFLDTGRINPNVRANIASSWKRSAAYGLNPESKVFPAKDGPAVPMKAGRARYNTSTWLYYFFDAARSLLMEFGGAEVCVDNNLTVTLIIGDQITIQDLSSKGLKVGTNLAESRVGTNAMALAYAYGREVWVYGDEHYLDALTGYVCVASWWQPPITSNYSAYSSMVMIPKDRYLDAYRPIIHMIIAAQETFKLQHQQPLNIMRGKLIDMLMDHSHYGYLLVDSNGVILQYNERLFDYVGNHITSEKSDYLQDCYPSLAYAVRHSKSSRAEDVRLLHWAETGLELRVVLQPIWTSEEPIGTIVMVCSAAAERYLNPGDRDKPTLELSGQLNSIQHRAVYSFDDFITGNSQCLKQLSMAKRAAQSDTSVLILGENGTGKSMLAQAIHNASSRKGKPFVEVHCTAIPHELFLSEMLGYAEGIYTGARKYGASGKVEEAKGGTLYLNEVCDIPLGAQTQLLTVFKAQALSRLGEPTQMELDIRIIASSSKNLYEMVLQKQMLPDFFYYLNVLSLNLPALRDRAGDIELLARCFLKEFSAGKDPCRFSAEVMSLFQEYHWPGNVQELRNVIERCTNVTTTHVITLEDLPADFVSIARESEPGENDGPRGRGRYSKQQVMSLMEQYEGNKSRVCEELGISRPTLYRKLKQWGLYNASAEETAKGPLQNRD